MLCLWFLCFCGPQTLVDAAPASPAAARAENHFDKWFDWIPEQYRVGPWSPVAGLCPSLPPRQAGGSNAVLVQRGFVSFFCPTASLFLVMVMGGPSEACARRTCSSSHGR